MSHTPGPWKVDQLCVESAKHGNICLVNLPRSSKADLNLIASAPDLLAALREARERMLGNSPAIKALREKTDAAISKAEGRS